MGIMEDRIRELEEKVLDLEVQLGRAVKENQSLKFALHDCKRHLLTAEKKTFQLRKESRP